MRFPWILLHQVFVCVFCRKQKLSLQPFYKPAGPFLVASLLFVCSQAVMLCVQLWGQCGCNTHGTVCG